MLIVQHNLMNDNSLTKIKSAVDKHNIPHKYVGLIPFSHEITSDEPLVGTNFLPYGSTLMTTLTGPNELAWDGNYWDPNSFRSEVWNVVRDDMLNAGDVTMTIANAV